MKLARWDSSTIFQFGNAVTNVPGSAGSPSWRMRKNRKP